MGIPPFLRAALGKDLQCRPVCIFQLFLEPFSQLEPEVECALQLFSCFGHTAFHRGWFGYVHLQIYLLVPGWNLNDIFTRKHFYTQTLLHTDTLTPTRLHTDAFTHRSVHTQTYLHTEAFTHRRFYTQKRLHTDFFHTDAFTYRSFYTQMLLHADAFTHRHFLRQRRNPFLDLRTEQKADAQKRASIAAPERNVHTDIDFATEARLKIGVL